MSTALASAFRIVSLLVATALACRSPNANVNVHAHDGDRSSNQLLESKSATTSWSYQRIVSLHDMTTDILVLFHAADRLVGASKVVDPAPETQARLQHLPQVGDLESVLRATPDLVVAYAIVERHEPELFARLRAAGIEVRVFDPQSIAQLEATLREMGELVGRQEAAQQAIVQLHSSLAQAQEVLHGRRFFVYDCCDPPLTAGARTVLSQALVHAGATNIFGSLESEWTRVGWEDVLLGRPDLVVFTDYGETSHAEKVQNLAKYAQLKDIEIVSLPLREALAGPRLAAGLTRLTQKARAR